MAEHTGYMQVRNDWITPISGKVTHHTSDWPDTEIVFTNLAVGATTPPQSITTSTSNTDHWQYSMTDGSGYTWSGEKDCGFESEDDGGTVTIAFDAQEMQLQVNMPKSSSCSQGLAGHVGLMTVTNSLWAPISGYVQHYATDYGTTIVRFTNLGVNESTPAQGISTGATNRDQWEYSIQMSAGGGELSSAGSHNCGFESEDSCQTVTLEFKGTDKSDSDFLMTMPKSSSCSSGMSFTSSTASEVAAPTRESPRES
jgi:hypothetical protein